MKKSCLRLLIVPVVFSSLVGCSKTKERLTYGTFINQTIYTLKEIDTQMLYEKCYNEKEVFLLATYQKGYSEDCLCWNTFENVLAKYMNSQNERVYIYNSLEQDDSISDLKIVKYEDSTPSLYIFKGEKQLAKFSYNSQKDNDIFSDLSGLTMSKRIHEYVTSPLIYDIDETFLDENINKTTEAVVLFAREKCGDCKYVLPNVLIPYINSHNVSKNVWLFDMQKLYDLSKNESASEEEKAQYQALKDRYGLSATSNQTFGYLQGVVPTMQYYQSGVLKDASVYFNDVIGQKDDGFYISDSYYSNDRLVSLNYLKNCSFTTVLKGMTITEGVLQTKTGDYYWSQVEAAKYHTPILEAFLNQYL